MEEGTFKVTGTIDKISPQGVFMNKGKEIFGSHPIVTLSEKGASIQKCWPLLVARLREGVLNGVSVQLSGTINTAGEELFHTLEFRD